MQSKSGLRAQTRKSLAVFAAVIAISACSAPEGAPSSGPTTTASDRRGPYPVTTVVDGDTIYIDREGRTVKLRLIGIDTPETKRPGTPVQCFGREASAAAHELLDNQEVLIAGDPTQDSLDRYGRELVYVWLADGTFVNLKMISDGYAHEYTYDLPYQFQAQFKQAQRDAEAAGRGLWNPATCAGETTREAQP